MKQKRRDFIKYAGLTGLAITGGGAGLVQVSATSSEKSNLMAGDPDTYSQLMDTTAQANKTLIGPYGTLADTLLDRQPSMSFRSNKFTDVDSWRTQARQRLTDRLGIPDMKMPEVTVVKQYEYDGLHIEELRWSLPYGRPTDAILLKPINVKGPLPGILAFHDHGGNKYFGTKKITRTGDQHPLIVAHQEHYYDNRAWANEIAKRGYVVLVSDAFPFASRRVMLQDVPEHLRENLTDADHENPKNIQSYNEWAGRHEHVMAKSLFSAGTTWPGVFFAEDRVALDVLTSRKDVMAEKIGCAGLSGGGMRTVFMGGLDPRIKCAVCVGFMTTWRDFALTKSYTHTWMTYVPMLPVELDFPEILGLRVPLPTLVQNDEQDQLYTITEMKKADKILEEVYKKANSADKYKCSFYPGPHKFDIKMQDEAFAWFDRWLK